MKAETVWDIVAVNPDNYVVHILCHLDWADGYGVGDMVEYEKHKWYGRLLAQRGGRMTREFFGPAFEETLATTMTAAARRLDPRKIDVHPRKPADPARLKAHSTRNAPWRDGLPADPNKTKIATQGAPAIAQETPAEDVKTEMPAEAKTPGPVQEPTPAARPPRHREGARPMKTVALSTEQTALMRVLSEHPSLESAIGGKALAAAAGIKKYQLYGLVGGLRKLGYKIRSQRRAGYWLEGARPAAAAPRMIPCGPAANAPAAQGEGQPVPVSVGDARFRVRVSGPGLLVESEVDEAIAWATVADLAGKQAAQRN